MSNLRTRAHRPSATGWLALGLLALALTSGCNVCAGSVCGDDNNESKVSGNSAPTVSGQPMRRPPLTAQDTSPPTKAQYIAAADAICTKWRSQAEQLSDAEIDEEIMNQVISLERKMADEWHALTPPAGDSAVVDTFIDKQYADIATRQRFRDLWSAGKTDEAQAELDASFSDEIRSERRAAARAYGFRVCF